MVPVWRLHVPVDAMSAGISAGDADNLFYPAKGCFTGQKTKMLLLFLADFFQQRIQSFDGILRRAAHSAAG